MYPAFLHRACPNPASFRRSVLHGATLALVVAASGSLLSGMAIAADQVGHAGHTSQARGPSEASTAPLLTRELGDIEGKEVMMLTVDFAPGHASAPHRHNAHTFVYVLEGAVIMGVEGGPEKRIEAGQTFYESPSDIHTVSRNASKTEPAKILVFFVKDKGASTVAPPR
jgi:quercetin dioxygenase-like cupin family protein